VTEQNRGLIYALTAYLIWGTFPLLFSLFKGLPAMEVLAHRIAWSAVFVAIIITLTGKWHRIKAALTNKYLILALCCSTTLIAANWGLYIWAAMNERAVEASLGYFIHPLVSVGLGVFFLKESLSTYQKVALLLAVIAVVYKVTSSGALPWISLSLAASFALYGFVRKQTQVDTVTGLMIETTLALPFTLIFWLFTPVNHFGFNLQGGLFILAGILTAIPLLAFAAAARRISLSMIGFLMYLNPTLQLLCAVFILGEPFTHTDLITFSLIWIGLAIFTGGTYWRHRKDRLKLRPSVTSS